MLLRLFLDGSKSSGNLTMYELLELLLTNPALVFIVSFIFDFVISQTDHRHMSHHKEPNLPCMVVQFLYCNPDVPLDNF